MKSKQVKNVVTPVVIPSGKVITSGLGAIAASIPLALAQGKSLNIDNHNNDGTNSFIIDEKLDSKILKKHEADKIKNNIDNASILEEKIKNKELFLLLNGNYIVVKNTEFSYEELIVLNQLYKINSTELIPLKTFKQTIIANYKKISIFKIDMIIAEIIKKNIFIIVNNEYIKITENTIKIFIELFEEE